MITQRTIKNFNHWYEKEKRDLPWRKTKDPYKIWISEAMLQQTTSRAVIPFYQKFLQLFPTLQHLAKASDAEVVAAWAGLGYYSRARNLHKAAQLLAEKKTFPKTYEELLLLPGFGPYTSRAVASLAFEQPVGVVDGNTIRVISRLFAWSGDWWKTSGRAFVQEQMDKMIQFSEAPSMTNQAFMELGATICTPTNPTCLLCPLKKNCLALKNKNPSVFPSKKPKRLPETWIWQPEIRSFHGLIALERNKTLPFLKNQWLLPGSGEKVKKRPQEFDYIHTITHHKIFVVTKKLHAKSKAAKYKWVHPKELKQWCPVSLVEKALNVTPSKKGE